MDYSLLGSSVHVILQARVLEWVAISFSRRSSQPEKEDLLPVSTIVAGFLLYLPSFRQRCYACLVLLQRRASPSVREEPRSGTTWSVGDLSWTLPLLTQGSLSPCWQVTPMSTCRVKILVLFYNLAIKTQL